jgi:hypothetical protein
MAISTQNGTRTTVFQYIEKTIIGKTMNIRTAGLQRRDIRIIR